VGKDGDRDIIHAAACGLSFHHLGKDPTPAVSLAHRSAMDKH
jgi:hypothetical protein